MKTLAPAELTQKEFVDWPIYMSRAIELAGRVISTTPNPRVGCVLVKAGRVIAEGWHAAAGQAHAEVEALTLASSSARGATAFITLEPCSHFGRTGPCSEALTTAGVVRVVIAGVDPNPRVSGSGIADLEAAGIEVFHLQDFEPAARELNLGYFKRRELGLPRLTLKFAMSIDGRIALSDGRSKWITGAKARHDVQALRAASSAILTGINTLLADDPALTLRTDELDLDAETLRLNSSALKRHPLRAVVDSELRTPASARVFKSAGKVVLYTTQKEKRSAVGDRADIRVVDSEDDGVALRSVLRSLAVDYECNDVLVEAGPTLSGALVTAGLVDRLIVYMAPKLLGENAMPLLSMTEPESLELAAGFELEECLALGQDVRLTYKPLSPNAMKGP